MHRDLPDLHRPAGHQLPRRVQSARPRVDAVLAVHGHTNPGRLHIRGRNCNLSHPLKDENWHFSISSGIASAADVHVCRALCQHFSSVRWTNPQLPRGLYQHDTHLARRRSSGSHPRLNIKLVPTKKKILSAPISFFYPRRSIKKETRFA